MGNESERNHRSIWVSGVGCLRLVCDTNVICKLSCFITLAGNVGVKKDEFVNAQGLCDRYGWERVTKCFCADNA